MAIQTVLDRFATPPCAKLLGLDILAADPTEGRVRIGFEGRAEFCNAAGGIQGGLLTAMLDDCIGSAVLIGTDAQLLPTTISLHVNFLAPAKPGRLIGEASIQRMGKTIGFIEASLRDEAGQMIATAGASVRVVPLPAAIARS
jgi:uncharacterized protein (TIGR00369 family)